MDPNFLNVRLTEDDKQVLDRLQQSTGLSKSAIVKRALRSLVLTEGTRATGGLFALGATRFGRYGSANRQSTNIKSIARARALAKRTGR